MIGYVGHCIWGGDHAWYLGHWNIRVTPQYSQLHLVHCCILKNVEILKSSLVKTKSQKSSDSSLLALSEGLLSVLTFRKRPVYFFICSHSSHFLCPTSNWKPCRNSSLKEGKKRNKIRSFNNNSLNYISFVLFHNFLKSIANECTTVPWTLHVNIYAVQ